MANVIEILINAKNNASAEIDRATGGLGKFATAAGLGAMAGSMAGQAIVTAMQGAKQAILDMTLAQADNVEMLDRMSNFTGLSVQKLDLYRQELEAGGLSADQLSNALRYLRTQLNAGDEKLAAFGITSKDTFIALQQMAQAMARATDVAGRSEVAIAALGVRNAELAENVANSTNAMGTLQAEAMRNGTAMTAEYLDKMRSLDAAIDTFNKTTLKSFQMAMAETFGPVLETITNILNTLNELKAHPLMNGQLRGFNPLIPRGGGGASGGRGGGADWGDPAQYGPLAFGPGNQAGINAMSAWYIGRQRGGGGGVVDPLVAKLDELLTAWKNASATGGGAASILGAMAGGLTADGSGKSIEDPVTKAFDRVQEAAAQFGTNFAGSLSSTLTQALSITTGSMNLMVQVFTSLANSVVATLADMMARAAAMGLVKLALNFLPTGGASVASKVGGLSLARTSMAGAGNTFVIQSINTRDALDDLMNSTGSLRRANDRMRDISIAAMG